MVSGRSLGGVRSDRGGGGEGPRGTVMERERRKVRAVLSLSGWGGGGGGEKGEGG